MLLKLLLCVEFRRVDSSDWREVAANIVVALGYDWRALRPSSARDFAGKTKALFGRTAAGALRVHRAQRFAPVRS